MAELWPFIPLVTLRESLSWKTDVRTTPGSDLRESLRDGRLILTYDFHAGVPLDAKAENLFRTDIPGDWLVPVWSESTLFSQLLPAGETLIPANTWGDYRVGAFAFLRGLNDWRMGEIVAVAPEGITLAEPCGIAVRAVAPLRLAFIVGGLGGSRLFNGATVRQIVFSVRDSVERPLSVFPQYRGLDVLTDATVITSPVATGLTQAREYIDNGSGQVAIETRRDIIEGKSELRLIDRGLAAMVARKRWFQSLRGRDRAFWLPTWARDHLMYAPISAGDTWMDVFPLLGSEQALVGRHIRVADAVGPLLREIIVATDMGDFWRLGLGAVLGDLDPGDGGAELYVYIAVDANMGEGEGWLGEWGSNTRLGHLRPGLVAFIEKLKARYAASGQCSLCVCFYGGMGVYDLDFYNLDAFKFDLEIDYAHDQVGHWLDWGSPYADLRASVDAFFGVAPVGAQKVLITIGGGGGSGDAAGFGGAPGFPSYAFAFGNADPGVALFDNTPDDGVPFLGNVDALEGALDDLLFHNPVPFSFPRDVAVTALVSWLMRVRLDTDTVEFTTTGGISMETAVVVTETVA